jgi:hypothetical protein
MTPAAFLARWGLFATRRRAGFFVLTRRRQRGKILKDNIWFQSALWMALALLAAMGSLFITISAALFEIIVGAIAGNTVGLPLTPWINYIASFGAVVLTFLAGIVRWLSSPSNSIVPEGRRWLPRPGCCESP